MKKILILLVLCLGVLGFSNDGFKNLKWGAPKEDVIKLLGTKYDVDKKDKNKIIYSSISNRDKLYFANLEFLTLDFKFEDNRLVAWEGYVFTDISDFRTLMDAYFKKYGKNFYVLDYGRDGSFFTYYDENGVIEIYVKACSNSSCDTYIDLKYRTPFSSSEERDFLQEYLKEKNKINDDI